MFRNKELEKLQTYVQLLEAQIAEANVDERIKKLEDERDQTKLLHSREVTKYTDEISRLRDIEKTLQKNFDDQKALAYKTMELEFKGKQMDEVQKIRAEYDAKLIKANEENFEKLKSSLSKLHEEGNAQTKFTEQIALKMMDAIKPNSSKLISE